MKASQFVRFVFFVSILSTVSARSIAEEVPRWIDPAGVSGKLFIAGGGKLPDSVVAQFVGLAGGKDAKLVVIPTASETADKVVAAELAESWKKRGVEAVSVLHTADRKIADTDEFVEPLKDATAVWFVGGSQSRIADAYVGTKVEQALHALLKRGGAIGGTSAGAAIQSKLMIASGNPIPKIAIGFDFLPGAVIDQHFVKRERRPRLVKTITENPEHVGFGIDEGTAMIVVGRRIFVLGDSTVTIVLAANAQRPLKEIVLKNRQTADLTALRRAARDRQRTPFPPKKMSPVHVENGALLIVGGGGMTRRMVDEFVQKAGGKEKARIVILPVSSTSPRGADFAIRMFKSAGAKHVVTLAQRKKEDVESDAFLDEMRQATGVWFGGGRQWHFMDCYESTKAWPLVLDVLKRGGVMGGSSAGASIQSEYMVRGNPLGNTDMMADGYERGFGFLPGATVDQHFTQRGRHRDLEGVIRRFPQLLGIGIDETTAIWVEKDKARVLGQHTVYFIEATGKNGAKDLRKQQVRLDGVFDLKTRSVIRAGRPAPPPLPENPPRRNPPRL
jgi:cyanophycinase